MNNSFVHLAIVIFVTWVIGSNAFAKDPTIFDVRKPIALKANQVTYQDFYINAGSESGLKPGLVIEVMRSVPLYDTFQNKSAGSLDIAVAKIKIIHVQKGLAVARFHSALSRTDKPILEADYVMIGDRLELSTAVLDKGNRAAVDDDDEEDVQPKTKPAEATKVSDNKDVASQSLSSKAPVSALPGATPVQLGVH